MLATNPVTEVRLIMKRRMDAAAAAEDRALYELLITLLGIGGLAILAIATALLSV